MPRVARISCLASAFGVAASGTHLFRGSTRDHLVPVVVGSHNSDEFFQHSGPPALWGPADRPDGSSNICMEDHLVPELYVLGAPKAATTSFWMDTDKAGIKMPVHGLFMGKEFRFFIGQNLSEDTNTMKSRWLMNMPNCSQEAREIVADFNPHNLATIQGDYNPLIKKVGPGLPLVLKNFYLDRSANLKFLVMLREPLSRMQSHWHMNKKTFPFVDFGATTFNDSMAMLHREMETQDKAGHIREWIWLWESMYGVHLPFWLDQFEAKQFFVVPMKEYTQGNAQTICKEMSARMAFPIDCVGSDPESLQRTNTNVHDHVGVDAELDAQLLEKFDEFFGPINRKLYRALAKANVKGTYLANYEGTPGDVIATRTWLKAGW